jgi:hypothetical protein
MKHFIFSALIFVGILGGAFVATTYILNHKASAQTDLTENIVASQSQIAQKVNAQLEKLDQLKSKLNDDLFQTAVFQSLVDYSLPLPDEPKGRANPFAPIGQ